MYGIFWTTKDKKSFFQSYEPNTTVDWGHYSMDADPSGSYLFAALTEDDLVEMVVSFGDYDVTVYKNGKELKEVEGEKYLKEIEHLTPKMEVIYDNDIEVEDVEDTYGSCELCEYEGTEQFFSLKNGRLVKHEIGSDDENQLK